MKKQQTVKISIRIICLAAATGLLLACGGKANPAPQTVDQPERALPVVQTGPQFADAVVSEAWRNYMQLRKSMVETNAAGAAAAALALQKSLGATRPDLGDVAAGIAATTDVEAQRTLFAAFIGQSEAFFAGSLKSGIVYKQFCPMAFGNKGGYWLSDAAEIRNPYFGDKMLTCGTVAATLESEL